MQTNKTPDVIVAIATVDRPDITRATLEHLASLKDQPDRVVLSVSSHKDFDLRDVARSALPVEFLFGKKGLCAQRNAVLDTAPADAIVLYIDDDFLLADGYVSATKALFAKNPDVVMATGLVLADGILGPGMCHKSGLQVLEQQIPSQSDGEVLEVYNGYGCNMAVRMDVVKKHNIRFDEAMPRYGWLEDVDFSRALAEHGRVVKDSAMVGVHLGTKVGRSRGVPLGYSQIANPVYLTRKGTMHTRRALRMILRNIAANAGNSPRPEPWVDRRGRLRGNLLGLRDLLLGRLSPSRILSL
ncbi:MAG: glycosyltransferase [Rhodobacteraceae bacterium]|nr:glycosyltransferase [Paracoccaceae bacterium]